MLEVKEHLALTRLTLGLAFYLALRFSQTNSSNAVALEELVWEKFNVAQWKHYSFNKTLPL